MGDIPISLASILLGRGGIRVKSSSKLHMRMAKLIKKQKPRSMALQMRKLRFEFKSGVCCAGDTAENRTEWAAHAKRGYRLIERIMACTSVAALDTMVADIGSFCTAMGADHANSSKLCGKKVAAAYGMHRLALHGDVA